MARISRVAQISSQDTTQSGLETQVVPDTQQSSLERRIFNRNLDEYLPIDLPLGTVYPYSEILEGDRFSS